MFTGSTKTVEGTVASCLSQFVVVFVLKTNGTYSKVLTGVSNRWVVNEICSLLLQITPDEERY